MYQIRVCVCVCVCVCIFIYIYGHTYKYLRKHILYTNIHNPTNTYSQTRPMNSSCKWTRAVLGSYQALWSLWMYLPTFNSNNITLRSEWKYLSVHLIDGKCSQKCNTMPCSNNNQWPITFCKWIPFCTTTSCAPNFRILHSAPSFQVVIVSLLVSL